MLCQSITEPSGFGQKSNIMEPSVCKEKSYYSSPQTQWVWHPYSRDHGIQWGWGKE